MTRYQLLMYAPMFALLCWAVGTDLSERKIPNWLTCGLALAGLACSTTAAGLLSPRESLLGLLTGFGLSFVLFCIGARGAGDVKLFAAVGAWLGVIPVFKAFIVASIIALFLAIVWAAWQRKLFDLFSNAAVLVMNVIYLRDLDPANVEEAADLSKSDKRQLPYAVPILVAVLVVSIF